jgi:hypothetical protein
MSKFTPGPWHTGGIMYIEGKSKVSIWGPVESGKQSGDLVAGHVLLKNVPILLAAPEMYELLCALEQYIKAYHRDGVSLHMQWLDLKAKIDGGRDGGK